MIGLLLSLAKTSPELKSMSVVIIALNISQFTSRPL